MALQGVDGSVDNFNYRMNKRYMGHAKTGGSKGRAPRQKYSASALVYAGNRQLTCRFKNISSTGVLLYATESVGKGSFIRLNLTLPGIDEVLDVDGVVVRMDQQGEHLLLGIKFYEPSEEFTKVMDVFVEWLKRTRTKRKTANQQRASKAKTSASGPRPRSPSPTTRELPVVPPSNAEPSIDRRMTGPHFPRVKTEDILESFKEERTFRKPSLIEIVRQKAKEKIAKARGRESVDALQYLVADNSRRNLSPEEREQERQEVEARWSQREHQSKVREELNKMYREALKDMK